ncbi:MAG: adenosine-specific kinase [Nitrososphaera sp.]|uniref:adenosine-specific kinase n=1 Tax=Nitrososphaera sp. TaxID=1971748 RepID=UPI00182FC7AF|nr:adenosine-specific kinase [Nitrososphaera sp.]NWG37731.1 adenosine-specific kinase [Nitrososphaera sp.]
MELQSVKVQPPEGVQLVLAQSHFIKTVEDVYECLVNCVPDIRFGIAFCEASGPCLVRHAGNDSELEKLATDCMFQVGAGHGLLILMKNAFPINVLPRLKQVPEVANVFCATANAVDVIVAETPLGRAILGVVDGSKPKGIEAEKDVEERKQFLRKIGYKF